MKGKWIPLLCWVAQVLICTAGVVSFIILAISGEQMLSWIPTLLAAIVLLASGLFHIITLLKD